jgi:hypothetical protein
MPKIPIAASSSATPAKTLITVSRNCCGASGLAYISVPATNLPTG